MTDYLIALFLGIVEGLTEFLPISSTGHLILLIDGFDVATPEGHVFEVFIQLGAILAVMFLYRQKIWHTLTRAHFDPIARKFALNILIGTLPALCAGALLHSFIKEELYEPVIIAVSLIIGGIIILIVEKTLRAPKVEEIDSISYKQAFLVGCFQMIALMPGVSRSGATIIGSLLIGLSRKTAAEFSFFLAIPIMICAVIYDSYQNWHHFTESSESIGFMLAGFFGAFITALIAVKALIAFLGRYGFTPFAWYRIAIGLLALYIFL